MNMPQKDVQGHADHTTADCLQRAYAAMQPVSPSADIAAVRDEYTEPDELLPCGCPEQLVADCGHQEGCQEYVSGQDLSYYPADDRDWVSLLELSWSDEAAQDEWVDSAMDYLAHDNPKPPF